MFRDSAQVTARVGDHGAERERQWRREGYIIMVHVSRTFQVDKPVETVVDYLADFGHAVQWDPGTVRCERADDGPVRVGSTWTNVSRVLGRETTLTYRLERWEAGRITLVGRNRTATSTDDITVHPDGTGSTVTYRATIDFHGAAVLAAPIMKLEFERLGTKTQRRMQEAITRLQPGAGTGPRRGDGDKIHRGGADRTDEGDP
jgi:carbon monoxide dehydrogenase subunit G